MAWTKKQQRVIEERDRTILVSAAAGSGKTATLVERIYEKVTDPDYPIDITSFLVVTFTKAASAQMKDKLMAKLEEALSIQPESEHLARQNMLLQNADITTIDSFCLNIVKEYFSFLELDPSISIGDPGMMEMLKYDVMTELFDQKYQEMGKSEEPTDFERLLDLFCDGKKDDKLREIIDKIYRQMTSVPDPDRFLQEAKQALCIDTIQDLNQAAWMCGIFSIMHKKAEAAIGFANMCMELCDAPDGPAHYKKQFEADIEKLTAIKQADDYAAMRTAISLKWMPLSRKKFEGDTELLERCKQLRKEYKDDFSAVDCFVQSAEDLLADIKWQRTYLLPLLALTEEFVNLYMAEKKKRKQLEFSDISHMAFRLVCAGYDEDGMALPTEIGKSIAARYEEIYIDEYQDSNYLQEDILTAVSGRYRGDYNMFMVGDVKQSIYRFRMARPEIFVKKYNRFRDDGDEIKIELNHNFRSRAVCLDVINFFFYQLMGEDLGGIAYDEKQALVPGKEFEEAGEGINIAENVELLLADAADKGDLTDEMLEAYQNPDKDTLEGLMIANRIRELTDAETGMYVYDEDREEYRLAQYRDIVILARSLKGYGESVYNALTSQGIPVYLEKTQGYFQAVEIQVILSLLAVVDNSRQDIPLSAVLLSPIGNLDESELTSVCGHVKNKVKDKLCLYEKCEYYVEDCGETEIGKKLARMLGIIGRLKRDKQHLSVSDLIWELLVLTDYYEYAAAMPAGNIRRSNIEMLLEKATEFENGYYKGLFHFLRYVDKLKLIERDEGEASVLGEDANVVRIMSIHKSKGLEFPIVFTAGLGKRFNRMELSDNVMVHPDYYLAAMSMHPEARYKHNTALRSIYAYLEDEEMTAENLRVLYVAMTRAKEKLILTACVSDTGRMYEKYAYLQDADTMLLPYNVRNNAGSYIQQVIACMQRYERLAEDCHVKGKIRTCFYNQETVLCKTEKAEVLRRLELEDIRVLAKDAEPDAFYEKNCESFSYAYPCELLTKLSGKLSVSDIKKMKAFDGETFDISREYELSDEADVQEQMDGEVKTSGGQPYDPDRLTGAERGTIVHKFMELLPFEQLKNCDDIYGFVKCQKEKLRQDQIMDEREISAISVGKITKMLQSKLGCRMIEAASSGTLYKERQFSACVPVSEVYDIDSDEVLIVQGIIDAYFYEDGEVVLMDYKTDVADEETLLGRYKAQLATYAEIIEQLTGDKVKEQIIYSFHLGKEIIVF